MLPMVTAENYFSREMNMAYMGATQFKAFDRCEAAALAELRGEYAPAAYTAMLIGSYVDAYFSGELPVFQAQHPEIFKRDGSLKAEFVHAQDVIARMESDELYMLLMSGKKQVILTGEIAGVPFKVKIDSLLDAETSRRIAERFPETAEVMGMCDGALVIRRSCGTWPMCGQMRNVPRCPLPSFTVMTFRAPFIRPSRAICCRSFWQWVRRRTCRTSERCTSLMLSWPPSWRRWRIVPRDIRPSRRGRSPHAGAGSARTAG